MVVAGSTGESATVTDEEVAKVLRQARRVMGRRALLIANTGTSDTADSCRRAREFSGSQYDVDALLVAAPAYVRPTQEGLFRHFSAIAQDSRIPVLLYNVPSRTAVDILPTTVARLARVPRIVGIKEAVGEPSRVRELISGCGPEFRIRAVTISPRVKRSGQVRRGDFRDRQRCTASHGRHGGRRHPRRPCRCHPDRPALVALHRNLFVESNPSPSSGRWADGALLGDTLRLPLTGLSPEYHAIVTESDLCGRHFIGERPPAFGVELLKSKKVARLCGSQSFSSSPS